jgi:hypothetical protein
MSRNDQRGIETVTVFTVEETLKGDVPRWPDSPRVPGGVTEPKDNVTRVKVVPGAPR